MLYFIKSEDKQKNANGIMIIKIGVSKNPIFRLKELQTGNHNKLTLIKTIQCENYRKLETEMHKLYKNNNTCGEWFEFSINEFYSCIDKAEELAEKINKEHTIKINSINNNQINLNNSNNTQTILLNDLNNILLNNKFQALPNDPEIIFKNSLDDILSNKKYYNLKNDKFEANLYTYIINGYDNDCVSISNTQKEYFEKYLTNDNKFLTMKLFNENNKKFTYAIMKDFCNYNKTIIMSNKLSNNLDAKNNDIIKITFESLKEISCVLVSIIGKNIITDHDKNNFNELLKSRNILYKNELIDYFVINDIYSKTEQINFGIIPINFSNIIFILLD